MHPEKCDVCVCVHVCVCVCVCVCVQNFHLKRTFEPQDNLPGVLLERIEV